MRILPKLEIDQDLVIELVMGKGILGESLSGSIDIDNIDNVYRMATLLGIKTNIEDALYLVDAMISSQDGLVLRKQQNV